MSRENLLTRETVRDLTRDRDKPDALTVTRRDVTVQTNPDEALTRDVRTTDVNLNLTNRDRDRDDTDTVTETNLKSP